MKTDTGIGPFLEGAEAESREPVKKKGRIFNTSLQGGYKIVESFPHSLFLHLFFDDHEM